MRERVLLIVSGTVQGVGFRPFVHRLAAHLELAGRVCNEGSRVSVDLEGPAEAIAAFVEHLRTEGPPAARIEELVVRRMPSAGYTDFRIVPSEAGEDPTSFGIPADLAICEDCRREMLDLENRYYRYPFISCTQCGPRYTVSQRLPFDRETTVMEQFPLCGDCAREYKDPSSRRFHAQTTACAECGPELRWMTADGRIAAVREEALEEAKRALRRGLIVAVLGIGGFHLAVNATDAAAVDRLRQRKRRPFKPFAVMMTTEAVDLHCVADEDERRWLSSPVRPIVLLRKREGTGLAGGIAPGMDRYGVFLPYTGVHVLLTEDRDLTALVMTSGNLSGEPLAYTVEDGLARLGSVADGFLVHNRPILRPVDDSVVRVDGDILQMVRRSRGVVPEGVRVGREGSASPVLLAVGGDLKNAFAVSARGRLWLGPHIGDLDDPKTQELFRSQVAWYLDTLKVRPEWVVHDLHPAYESSAYAVGEWERTLGVQHHHAHMAAVMLEHRLEGPVIGVILDGTGYGEDGQIWGGELIVGDCRRFKRAGHLESLRMVVGDRGTKEPWRLVFNYLYALGLWDAFAPGATDLLGVEEPAVDAMVRVLRSRYPGYNSSSTGRLFDMAGALVTGRTTATFEGELPMLLEAQVDPSYPGWYQFPVVRRDGAWDIALRPAVEQLLYDVLGGRRREAATKFHRGLAVTWARAAAEAAMEHGISTVVLGGGVWQNRWLLRWFVERVENTGLRVFYPVRWPANDGALAAGQIAVAAARLSGGDGSAPVV